MERRPAVRLYRSGSGVAAGMAAPAAAGCTAIMGSTAAAAVTGTVQSCAVAPIYRARITAVAIVTLTTNIAGVALFMAAPECIEVAGFTAAALRFTGIVAMYPPIVVAGGAGYHKGSQRGP